MTEESSRSGNREARTIDEARNFSLQDFVRQLLPVTDGLERGLDAAAEDDGERAEALWEGVEGTLRLRNKVLANTDVEEIESSR